MRSFIYTFSGEYTRELAIELIPLGVEPIVTGSKTELLDAVEKNQDIRNLITEYPDIDLVNQLIALQSDLCITLLLHNHTRSQDLLRLTRGGVKHVIHFHENPSEMAEDIWRTILEGESRNRDKRLHYRVQPKPSERIQANIFRREDRNFFRGNVVDISAGGFAIQLSETAQTEHLEIGHTYDPVMLSIPGTQVKTLSTLVAKRNNIAGFKYDNVEPVYRKKIAEYIFVNMQQRTTYGDESPLMMTTLGGR